MMVHREREIEKVLEEHKKARGPSLVEAHQQKMNKKRKEEGDERKPFDRERDLNAGYIDATKRSKMIAGAKKLDNMFTKGGL